MTAAIRADRPLARFYSNALRNLGVLFSSSRFVVWTTLGVFTLCFFGTVGVLANAKLKGDDELLTYYIAQRPTIPDVWDALCDGPDLSPPVNHFATRLSLYFLGDNHLALRLPPMIGFWLMSLFIYRSARFWCSPALAFCAMLLPLNSFVFQYAYEARPYGLLLGFGAGALTSWQCAIRSHHKLVFLLGITLCLCGAIATHWFGILILCPLVAGETVRSVQLGKCDVLVWCSFGLSLVTIAALLPIAANAQNTSDLWTSNISVKALSQNVLGAFSVLFGQTFCLLLGCVIIPLFFLPRATANLATTFPPPLFEFVAVLAMALLPLFGGVLAAAKTGIILPRYLVCAIIGASLLFALTLRYAVPRQNRVIVGVVLLAIATTASSLFMAKANLLERSVVDAQIGRFALLRFDANDKPALPIAVADAHTFFALQHYAPPTYAQRLVFVTGCNPLEEKIGFQLARWGHGPVEHYEQFLQKNKTFYLYEDTASTLLPSLLASGAALSSPERFDAKALYPRPGRLYRIDFK
jgi:Dolichyl-phosphate-mannose-protein mannosyltransferase